MFSFKKKPFTLEFQMLRGQNVSRLLATSFKILVANTQSLVALATSELQFRTLKFLLKISTLHQEKKIVPTNTIRKSVEFSQENLYVDKKTTENNTYSFPCASTSP